MAGKLDSGDTLPSLTLKLVGGGSVTLPEELPSNYGVLLIDTRSGQSSRRATRTLPIARYDFAVEGVPYNWARTFGAAFVSNAIGVAIGVGTARSCLTFDNLSDHLLDSSCGTAHTVGARVALVVLPLGGVTFAANRAGRTEGSKGSFWATMLGAARVLVTL